MKWFYKVKRAFALVLALLILSQSVAAFAAVNLSAKADKTSVQVGDTFDVTVTISGKNLAIAEGIFTYDPAVLAYAGSEGGASDGLIEMVSAQKNGADTLAVRIRFSAVGAGSAKIEVSVEKVLGYDGKEQESAKASVSVSVSAPDPTPAPTPISYAAEGVLAQNVKDASESLYIWRSLENVTVPSRYSETTLEYHGETVAAARAEESDAPVLVYASNAAGGASGYYIFDAAEDKLYLYQTISSVSKTYIILEPDGSVAPPQGVDATTLIISEKEYTAWKSQEAQDDIYLIYARNPDGEVGYFAYSVRDESITRYAVMPARPVQPALPLADGATPVPDQAGPDKEQQTADEITLSGTLFYAMCGVGVLLLITIVLVFIVYFAEKARNRRR